MAVPIYDVRYILENNGRTIVPGSGGTRRLRKVRLKIPADIPAEPSLLTLLWREYWGTLRSVTRGGAR